MAFTKAQTGVSGNSGANTTTVSATAFGSAPAAGSIVCVEVFYFSGSASAPTVTVSDGTNSYTKESHDSSTTNITTAGWIGQFYFLPSSAGGKTITATYPNNGASGACAIWCDNFTPPGGTTVAYDSGAVGSGTGDATTPTIPVSTAGELVYAGAVTAGGNFGAGTPFTANDAGSVFGNLAEFDLSLSANTAVNFTGGSGAYNAIGMSFKAVASGGAAKPFTLLQMMGVG